MVKDEKQLNGIDLAKKIYKELTILTIALHKFLVMKINNVFTFPKVALVSD